MGGVCPMYKETNLGKANEDSVTAELTFDKLHEMIDVLSQAAQVMNPNAPVLLTVGSAGEFNIMGRFSMDGNYD